jgi:1-acyl-sn-glycerol-3-phosphate acyltransferase
MIRHRERLPSDGPAIIASNHNSHLDTLVLLDMFPNSLLNKLRPVAAADYFLGKGLWSWFAIKIIGILPIRRKILRYKPNPLKLLGRSLQKNEILLFFPEGSRGDPERLSDYKAGLAKLAETYPHIPVYPVYCYGLGKALPRGDYLPVPFFIDVCVGEPLYCKDFPSRKQFMEEYTKVMHDLKGELPPRPDYQ